MKKNALLMTSSSFLFALMGVCVRFASQTIPVSEIVFFRSVIGFISIIPVILIQRTSFLGNKPSILIVRGVSGFLALSLYFWAVSKIPLAMAVMLNYTSPLFVAMLAPFILKEKFHAPVFFFIVFGFLGVILIVQPQTYVNFWGMMVGLISGVFAAGAYLSIGALKNKDSPLTIVFYFSWVSTLIATPLTWPIFKMPHGKEILYLGGTGILATIAQILMTQAYQWGSTAATSAYSSSIVLFSLILGMIFWKETPALSAILGGLLLVISVIFIARIEKAEVLTSE
ncbi:MAG: DMT family transporter [Chlamydiae bacterium]|nr:DMT family transporter [Chlamydiota bacterium]